MLKIVVGSDLHLRSSYPKPEADRSTFTFKQKITRSRPFQFAANKMLVPVYEGMSTREANLKPHTKVEQFLTSKLNVAGVFNRTGADFGVFNGDFFDLSRTTPGRDRVRQEDVLHAGRDLIDNVELPVLFLPGNSDVLYKDDLSSLFDDFSFVSKNSWDRVKGLADTDYEPIMDNYSNWSLKIHDCLVIGLNSVPPGEFKFPDDFNHAFVEQALSSCKKNVPVVVFTHHAPFSVLPWYFQLIGEGIPAQTWLLKEDGLLSQHVQRTGKPVLVTSGHCHQWLYEKGANGISTLCNLPLSITRGNIGVLIKADNEVIKVEKVRINQQ